MHVNAQSPICVAALYQFCTFAEPGEVQRRLGKICRDAGIRGTLLVASEGVNGTIAGSDAAVAHVVACIRALPGCENLDVKYSRAATMPFHRMKVRLKTEIVTLGEPGICPVAGTGTYVAPEDWNALIADPRTIVIDTRNEYEVAIGTFARAIDPKTSSFREFPAWFRQHRDALLAGGDAPRVAMFCTGGIRCEKATAFVMAEGVGEVYHLKGGILSYLENMSPADSLWHGECFVFDERVAVGHGLAPGTHELCRACRKPIGEADRMSPDFQPGVCCPACRDERNDAQRARYAERQRQVERAAARGKVHIGTDAATT